MSKDVNWENFEENKISINEEIGAMFPGVSISWEDDIKNGLTEPTLLIPENCNYDDDAIILAAQKIIDSYKQDEYQGDLVPFYNDQKQVVDEGCDT